MISRSRSSHDLDSRSHQRSGSADCVGPGPGLVPGAADVVVVGHGGGVVVVVVVGGWNGWPLIGSRTLAWCTKLLLSAEDCNGVCELDLLGGRGGVGVGGMMGYLNMPVIIDSRRMRRMGVERFEGTT